MASKACFKCGVEKTLAEFYRHPAMADGHLNKCKDCTKKDAHEHRHGKGRERVLAYDRERAKTPERVAHRAATVAKWNSDHPDRRKAHAALRRAVKSSLVTPWPACAVPECTSSRPVAHHPDYDRPLDVVWLCQAHHKQAHAITQHEHA